jgi:hypothetical protein
MVRFIGSKSILVCKCALPDLVMTNVCLFLDASLAAVEDDGGLQFGRGTHFFIGEILVLLLVDLVVQVCLISMFVSSDDHMYSGNCLMKYMVI